ncbi:MAG: glycosyltransferase family 39 protein [Lewinellaceae bacterium]|nr:glycosyltransferase family 39 protein [Lewinellaceae bacterium]
MILRYTGIFALFFTLTALASHYPDWLDLPPASIHQWRQADGAALAWNYARHPNLMAPEVCNLFSAADAHAVGEFPLLYWLSGCISRHLDRPEYPLRWIGLVLLFFGCWAFGWILLQLTRSPLLAAVGAGLLLGAPILVYYGPGFLPDAPAFCFVLLMAAGLFKADQMQSKGWLLAATVFATVAVLLKLSMAIGPLALVLSWLVAKKRDRWQSAPLWNSYWPLGAMLALVVLVLGFRWWVADYNAAHHTAYFLTTTRPIWNYSWPFILETFGLVGKSGLPVYASAGLYLGSMGTLWLLIQHWKTTPLFLRHVLLLTVLGSAGYFLLWFRMFREHDYYFLCLLAIPALLLLMGFRLAVQRFSEKKLVFALGMLWLLGLGHNYYAQTKRLQLAFAPRTSENLPPDAFLPPDALTTAGIPVSARILCPQDPSPNIALLALQRQGWTAYNFGDRITADTLHKYQTTFNLTHLALRDTNLYSPFFRQFFPAKICEIQGWYLYQQENPNGK